VTTQFWASVRHSRTPATFALLAVIAIGYLAQFVLGDVVTYSLAFYAPMMWSEPWRLVTAAFVHGSIMHVMFNAYSLWVLGNIIERIIGSAKFLLVFGISIIGGSLAVAAMNPESVTIGASAGIFGLFATLFLLNRGFGGSNVSLLVIIGINLALGFIIPGIAWQAHLGGLIGGLLTTLAIQRVRR
jgi:membrane associated rhomboid family serine protease